MRKIGIIGAMAQEVEMLRNLINNPKITQIASCTLYEGTINGTAVALVQSGIGKVAAAVGTSILLQLAQPDIVINTGSAGAIASGLSIGDIVISTETTYHDADVTAFGYAMGQLPNCPATFLSDEKLVLLAEKVVQQQGKKAKRGLICSGDAFIQGGERLSQIKTHFPTVMAVEMEAAAIAQVCYMFNIPFVVVRAISDGSDGKANMSFDEFLPIAAKASSEMVVAMLKELNKPV